MPRLNPHYSLAEDLTTLPHDTAYSKKQGLLPHMAVWMRQGCLMDKVYFPRPAMETD